MIMLMPLRMFRQGTSLKPFQPWQCRGDQDHAVHLTAGHGVGYVAGSSGTVRRTTSRMCGENDVHLDTDNELSGPSARAQGQIQGIRAIRCGAARPACAGRTDSLSGPLHAVKGPPRVRGELGLDHGPRRRVRTTPASAGRTRSPTYPSSGPWDHPRVCRENTSGWTDRPGCGQRTPRVRGELRAHRARAAQQWTTPAYAGRTLSPTRSRSGSTDHPPCAGRTRRRTRTSSSPWDHPACVGKTVKPSDPKVYVTGPPPRARGRQPQSPVPQHPVRTTPRARGRRCPDGVRRGRSSDHPRVCGENATHARSTAPKFGPPPHARQNQVRGRGSKDCCGSPPRVQGNVRCTPM